MTEEPIESEKKDRSRMIEVTGLYKNKTSEGKVYLAGNMGAARILIFQNDFKTEDKHPDFRMFLTENEARKTKPDDEGGEVDPFAPE